MSNYRDLNNSFCASYSNEMPELVLFALEALRNSLKKQCSNLNHAHDNTSNAPPLIFSRNKTLLKTSSHIYFIYLLFVLQEILPPIS